MGDLTDAEIESLKCCPASTNSNPEPGNRTAYVKRRLKILGFVQTLWVDDGDEIFFTWQRTAKGDEALSNGTTHPEQQD